MKYENKVYLLGTLVIVILIICLVLFLHKSHKSCADSQSPTCEEKVQPKGNLVAYPGRTFSYAAKFADANQLHLDVAKSKGLNSMPKTRDEVAKMKNKLVEISTCKNYVVEPLEYSVPYLCPYASKELDRIAADFADILQRNDLPHYRFIITSVLRTQEDVNRLQRVNTNASANSAHCFGTTFDITYSRFDKDDSSYDYMTTGNLALVLGQALLNEQRAGRVYVKYEKQQACFHITCR